MPDQSRVLFVVGYKCPALYYSLYIPYLRWIALAHEIKLLAKNQDDYQSCVGEHSCLIKPLDSYSTYSILVQYVTKSSPL